MSIAIITGSAGLIGSEAARYFAQRGLSVIGIDNDMRAQFFGNDASTQWQRESLKKELSSRYTHESIDIRNDNAIESLFKRFGKDVTVLVHAAAQPSHDWAAKDPHADFGVNATGTLNLLEATRKHCPEAIFVFTSTNKVYGDSPNRLPLVELETRWEIELDHGIPKALPRRCQSINVCTAFLVRRKLLRTSWCKSTDDTLACEPDASDADASPARTTVERNYMVSWHI